MPKEEPPTPAPKSEGDWLLFSIYNANYSLVHGHYLALYIHLRLMVLPTQSIVNNVQRFIGVERHNWHPRILLKFDAILKFSALLKYDV
ncbi:hypothetical protein A7K91_11060 [Paenibacillus oryzae]|uniref:Uncharacterized protein n=1 Tax=Paenibacillus oryzae TaxID=1844972 RepID=A0A1A5YTU5_9BACL|nr:hypothetical protein [Paenibacillus oryzae]OBR69042.1 hypothetical protein A7K91_11060 [Paenibacillus oryzae]